MPLFTPINPPEQHETSGSKEAVASLVHVEEEIRELLQQYQAALQLWDEEHFDKACSSFAELSSRDLILAKQDAHVEDECDAYSREYGGISINRFRSLVFANYGRLLMASSDIQTGEFSDLDDCAAAIDASKSLVLYDSLSKLQAALVFDNDDITYKMAVGQYSMLLGRIDIALSAFMDAVKTKRAVDNTDLTANKPLFHPWSPYQWQCAQAAVRAALIRGDAGAAIDIVNLALEQNQEASQTLIRLVEDEIGASLHQSLPPMICLPQMLPTAAPGPGLPAPSRTVVISSKSNIELLCSVGEEILAYYKWAAQTDTELGGSSDMLAANVPFEIQTGPDGVEKAIEEDDICKFTSADTNQDPKQVLPAAACSEIDDMDTTESGPDSNCVDDCGVPLKRVPSFSEDEHPIKRRSTRFSERTNLNLATQPAISGGCSSALGARMSATRGAARKDLVAIKEPADSEAFQHAYKQTCAWFEQSGVASEASLVDMLDKSQIATLLLIEQAPLHRKSSARPLQSIKTTALQWCLQVETKQTRGRKTDGVEKALQLITRLTMQYTIDALLTSNSNSAQSTPESCPVFTAAECALVFKDNHGVFDTMIRYAKAALNVLSTSNFGHYNFKQIVLRVLVVIHTPLLAQLTANLLDQDTQVLSLVMVIIQLLSEFAVRNELWREQCTLLWNEWTVVAGGAIAKLHSRHDGLKLQYRIAEAWTEYEMATVTSNLDRATAAINLCYKLLQHRSIELDHLAPVRCSLSGKAVSLEMTRLRRDHLNMFGKLREVTQLARSDEQHAISILHGLVSEEMCSTLQRIAAARLLAALCHRQSMKAKELSATLHELHLYLSLILESRQGSTQPVYLAVQHCSRLLKSVHSIAAADKQIAHDLSAANKFEAHLAAQLAVMLLALAKHFLVNPAPDSTSGSPEAVFIGYSAWLVAKLTSTLAASNPIDNNAESDYSDRRDSTCSDEPEMYIQFVDAIHEFLGERGLCTAADGAFLRLVLESCRLESTDSTDTSANWDVAGATLRCLFDIKLHNCDMSFHASAHVEMDVAAANATYMLVEKELLETLRNRKGAGLRNDLKTIVDRTSNALSGIDIGEHPRISMNMDIIDDYLDGTTMPTFGQIESALRNKASPVLVACIPLADPATELPTACVTLPFVRATMQHDLLRFRMRAGMARAVEDYDEILEDYKLYVSLHPTSAEAWLHLGQAHADLADELLLGTAAEILECQHDIAVLQRAALACAVQAKQYLQPLPRTNDKGDSDQLSNGNESGLLYKMHVRVYSFIGRLLYCIATRPLPLLAFQVLPSNTLIADDDNSLQQWDLGRWRDGSACSLSKSLPRRYTQVPSKQRVFALARKMLSRALRLDSSNWKWVYFLGKSVAKLGEPISACVLYLKASHIAAASDPNFAKSGGPMAAVPEVVMDSMCKLLSTVSKLLFSQKIDAATSRRFVDALPCLPSDKNDSQSRFTVSGVDPDSGHVFIAIRKVLDHMCASDKRRWHHRTTFLVAWMDHWIFGDSEQAKKALLSLLQMRNANKQLASFYKTDFEAPGKHYVYVEKYVHLYIDTLRATDDIDGLRLLERKLKRSSDFLYDLPAALLKITHAETDTLLSMVSQLNCPKFAIDASGNEHIMLSSDIMCANIPQAHSIFRHCRLNRTQFNYARDFAREHIASFTALQHHISSALGAPESEAVCAELSKLQTEIERHLAIATKAISLFGFLLEHRKAVDDPAVLSRINDGLADLYMLVLSMYGRSKCTALIPARNSSMDALVNACREASTQLAHMPRLDRPEGSFWHHIIFDESRHEKSQQYKLLDPLLEFQVNKLVDAVRESQLQPPTAALSEPTQEANVPSHTAESHTNIY
ncbi:Histone transcription regulator 3 [Coemansia sp. RSA 1821]|nr:Histone transcription regulator 3 [Coemansia sp. RSA 1821]